MIAALSWLACVGDPATEPAPPPAPDIALSTHGEDRGRGNLLGVQVRVEPTDYATPEAFDAVLRSVLDDADALGLLHPDTVVVLPEYLGAWLVALDEADDVLGAATVDDAMTAAVLANLDAFVEASADAPAADATTYAVFTMKAERIAEVYHHTLSALARDFEVTLVGGSVLLPDPVVVDGVIGVTAGAPLRNASFVYGPDGALAGPPVIKVYPTADEQPFVTGGVVGELPVFQTPAGRLGVLVCADSWYPEPYAHLAGRVDLLAVPVYGPGDGSWVADWGGYSGYEEPADVDPADIGTLTEGEAWHHYALPGRLDEAGAAAGVMVPLRGALWDLGTDGWPVVVQPDEVTDVAPVDGPQLVNVWL